MTITAPVDGRMGIRQLDAGNVIHASDTTPIAVLATLKPISVLFTLPEKNLAAVQKAMAAGPVTVVATREDGTVLGTGTLSVVDNEIDSTTGTARLKGVFPNKDERLWPGAFVHASVNVATLKDALTVPEAAVQRGPDGLYAWVVNADGDAVMKPIETGQVTDGARRGAEGPRRRRPGGHQRPVPAAAEEPRRHHRQDRQRRTSPKTMRARTLPPRVAPPAPGRRSAA